MYKKIIAATLVVLLTISSFGYNSEAAITDGYWRLDKFEETIYEKPFYETSSNPNIVRMIDFSKPQGKDLDANFKLGQTALFMHISESSKEEIEVEEIYKAYLKFTTPPVVIHHEKKFTMSYGGKLIKDTTNLMREVTITNYHQLLYPGRVPQPASVYIERGAEFPLISNEIGEEGLVLSKLTEITPLAPNSDDDTYVFRVSIESGTAGRSYAYVYRWVSGTFPGVGEIRVFIDNQLLISDVPPSIINSRTMLPVRAILEKLGADVGWDGITKTVIATKGDTRVKMVIGNPNVYVNGMLTVIDSAPIIIGDRTLVPARFLAETFDATVQWHEIDRTVEIILE
ncbi:MAG: copper amine oxidase N-terminal domain-containing protein [Gudongella sp.]|nr:copper amine oxidase N-terminal domain-containing protein [Gudongella sp.]